VVIDKVKNHIVPTEGMEVLFGLALWVALAIVLLVPPLVRDDVEPMAETWPILERWTDESADAETSAQTGESDPALTPGGRPIADGGRVCHNCGCYVDGDYLFCGECLMPKV
jgi:hypothetical protein